MTRTMSFHRHQSGSSSVWSTRTPSRNHRNSSFRDSFRRAYGSSSRRHRHTDRPTVEPPRRTSSRAPRGRHFDDSLPSFQTPCQTSASHGAGTSKGSTSPAVQIVDVHAEEVVSSKRIRHSYFGGANDASYENPPDVPRRPSPVVPPRKHDINHDMPLRDPPELSSKEGIQIHLNRGNGTPCELPPVIPTRPPPVILSRRYDVNHNMLRRDDAPHDQSPKEGRHHFHSTSTSPLEDLSVVPRRPPPVITSRRHDISPVMPHRGDTTLRQLPQEEMHIYFNSTSDTPYENLSVPRRPPPLVPSRRLDMNPDTQQREDATEQYSNFTSANEIPFENPPVIPGRPPPVMPSRRHGIGRCMAQSDETSPKQSLHDERHTSFNGGCESLYENPLVVPRQPPPKITSKRRVPEIPQKKDTPPEQEDCLYSNFIGTNETSHEYPPDVPRRPPPMVPPRRHDSPEISHREHTTEQSPKEVRHRRKDEKMVSRRHGVSPDFSRRYDAPAEQPAEDEMHIYYNGASETPYGNVSIVPMRHSPMIPSWRSEIKLDMPQGDDSHCEQSSTEEIYSNFNSATNTPLEYPPVIPKRPPPLKPLRRHQINLAVLEVDSSPEGSPIRRVRYSCHKIANETLYDNIPTRSVTPPRRHYHDYINLGMSLDE